jgi:hypothetical protein
MTHQAHDGEDLLRESKALVPRVQLAVTVDGEVVPLLAGFRGESLSLYFGPDPVYHFNAQGQLRRAFLDGRLVKADHGRLVSMERVHLGQVVELRSERLPNAQQDELLNTLVRRLQHVSETLSAGRAVVEGQVPEESDAVARLIAWLARNERPAPAESPHVG